MSKVNELYMDIELMLEQGTHPSTISAVLDVPVSWVYEVLEDAEKSDEEPHKDDGAGEESGRSAHAEDG
jgi:hypothetical protein